MIKRTMITKFNSSFEDVVDAFSNKEKLSEMKFEKFKFLNIIETSTNQKVKTFKRKFILDKEKLNIPDWIAGKIKPEYLEWEEFVAYDTELKTGIFSITPNIPLEYSQKFLCHGEFSFNLNSNKTTERMVSLSIDVKAPFLIKGLIETEMMNQIWLLLHHEKEVINDFFASN